MATAAQRLVTEAALAAKTATVIETPATGRRALVFPSGAVSEVGDTGWVDARPLIINGWTATMLKIRRQWNLTRVQFTGLDNAAATAGYFIQLPTGYGATAATTYLIAQSTVRTMWTDGNRRLSVDLGFSVKSTAITEVLIPVDQVAWPAALGGPSL